MFNGYYLICDPFDHNSIGLYHVINNKFYEKFRAGYETYLGLFGIQISGILMPGYIIKIEAGEHPNERKIKLGEPQPIISVPGFIK